MMSKEEIMPSALSANESAWAMLAANEPFWVVYNPFGQSPPREMHRTRGSATRAARSLARKTGEVFFVLKAQSAHQQQLAMCDFTLVGWGIGAPCPYHGLIGALRK